MIPSRVLVLLLLAVIAVALHFGGVQRGMYTTWWFDNISHFVSGAVLMAYIVEAINRWWVAFTVFFLLVAVWEIFEFVRGDDTDMWNSWRDMIRDTVFGTLGAVVMFTIRTVIL